MGATIRRRANIPGCDLISDTANTGSQPHQPGSKVVFHWSLDNPSILME
jgi:hypothetical protein